MATYVGILIALHFFGLFIALSERRGDKVFNNLVRLTLYSPLYYYVLSV